jgi:hypothetical protein
MPGPYPPDAPTVSGSKITVDVFLNTPARVNRAVQALTFQRFIADIIFGTGPQASGGAVVYDQVTTSDLYLARDVQEIEPGSEFPILTGTEPTPLVAIAKKYGGEVFLTYEQVRRNNRQVLNREMTRLRNTIVKRVDTIALNFLNAAPINTMAASGDWSLAATDIIADIADATGVIEDLDMGYSPDTVLLNPTQHRDLIKDKDIRDALPREKSDVPIATGKLGRLMGLDFISSNRVPAGTVYVLQRGIVGGLSDEIPAYAKVIDSERDERQYIHGARVVTPYVTDPKAVVKITGA